VNGIHLLLVYADVCLFVVKKIKNTMKKSTGALLHASREV
jgi:hypothetical protein